MKPSPLGIPILTSSAYTGEGVGGINTFSSFFNFIRTNLYNILFERIGYQTGASKEGIAQSSKTLRGIYLMFALCGVFGNLLAAGVYLLDNFTGKRKAAIMAELSEFRSQRKKLQEEFEETEVNADR